MCKLIFISLLIINCHFQQSVRVQEPNTACNWRGLKTCPIESSGSDPICDNTNPFEVSPGIMGMKICAAQTPKLIGDRFQVGIAVFGTILTVDSIPVEAGENSINCSDGTGSIGTRVFSAVCQLTGPGKMRGYWAITFKLPSDSLQRVNKQISQ